MENKIVIGYFYKEQLNLYGDNGNVEILTQRAKRRNIDVEVININTSVELTDQTMNAINVVFMGGGPDSGQKSMYQDLVEKKGPYLKKYIESGGVGLFICGAYQLMGHYYKADDGSVLNGLGIYDMYTQHFGGRKSRCVGNVIAQLNPKLINDAVFKSVNKLGTEIVGFCNHGGRTYLGDDVEPLGIVKKGYGNNAEDASEGVLYNNSIGTYFHGPFLSRNAHIADYLITKALKVSSLVQLDDSLILSAYTASKTYK